MDRMFGMNMGDLTKIVLKEDGIDEAFAILEKIRGGAEKACLKNSNLEMVITVDKARKPKANLRAPVYDISLYSIKADGSGRMKIDSFDATARGLTTFLIISPDVQNGIPTLRADLLVIMVREADKKAIATEMLHDIVARRKNGYKMTFQIKVGGTTGLIINYPKDVAKIQPMSR